MRPTFVSPSFHGISLYVPGSGIATMSDSSIALKPVIDEPAKPIPSSRAASSSLGGTATDLARADRERLQVPLEVGEPEQEELDPVVLDPLESVLAGLLAGGGPVLRLDLRHTYASLNAKSPERGSPEAPLPLHVIGGYQGHASTGSSSSSGSRPSCAIARP